LRIAIVDDDQLLCRSLALLLENEPDMEVVGTAPEGDAAFALMKQQRPDIVLMDIRMPGTDGIDATRRIMHAFPGTKIVMLTTFNHEQEIRLALDAGADGYLLKSGDFSSMAGRLRALASGSAILDPDALRELSHPAGAGLDQLTDRERDIVERIAHGYSNRETAEQLFLSERTVRNTVSTILDKLQLRDRTQLAIYYWRRA